MKLTESRLELEDGVPSAMKVMVASNMNSIVNSLSADAEMAPSGWW